MYMFFHPLFYHIVSPHRGRGIIPKEIQIIKEVTTTIQYFVANFESNAKSFLASTLHHWRVETYHYHLDMLTKEDDHIAYVNPFSMAILRSFAINLYQLYLNEHKGEKIMKAKITMAEIKRTCHHLDDFASEILEMEA